MFNIKKKQFVVLNDLIMINIKKVLVPMHPKQQILDMKYHILDRYIPSNFLRDTIRTIKVIREKFLGKGSLIVQDTIENVSEPNFFF